MSKFSFIDLFSGIGGFRLGLQKNGGICLGFSEINKDAIDFYCKNFDDDRRDNFGNITTIESLPQHDLLTAGVPCQSWSIAGKNLGFEDDRGQLWNDTIYLLSKSRPKAFIFENVKGLQDPRNKEAFKYILNRIKEAGYFAKWFLINSHDYGLPQNRVRVYIIGFKEEKYLLNFELPKKPANGYRLFHHLEDLPKPQFKKKKINSKVLFGKNIPFSRTKFQKKDELNDFFLFNDIRNGHSTIHSWDLIETTEREKEICYLLLTNRRKKKYGPFDGNPLSLEHFKELDSSISKSEIDILCSKMIFKEVEYVFEIKNMDSIILSGEELLVLELCQGNLIFLKDIKTSPKLKKHKIKFSRVLNNLIKKEILSPVEIRYDFKHSKISSGINGINRIYLPNSEAFSTLVASDTNDFIATENIFASDPREFKSLFLDKIVKEKKFRKIKKTEALVIQGFDDKFNLPEERSRWMKLIGNSVSVPVIDYLARSIVNTGVFEE